MKKKRPEPVEDEDLDGLDDEEIEARPVRRTLAQMAAETAAATAAAAGGVHCPKCGCRMSRVVDTWDVAGGRRRKRVCRHCEREWCTTEQ